MIKGTPNIEEGSKKRKSSPGVQDMLGAMKPEMSNEEMKQSLLSAIDKKVQAKCKYGKCSKISNTFLFLFSINMLVFRAEINKTLVRIANGDNPV